MNRTIDATTMRTEAMRRRVAELQEAPARQPAAIPLSDLAIKPLAGARHCCDCGQLLPAGRTWGLTTSNGSRFWCDQCAAKRSPEALAALKRIEG